VKPLSIVYGTLLVLLFLTVVSSLLPLGEWNSLFSTTIAIAKAVLILFYFMKLRESSGSLRLFAFSAVLWILFLFGMTAADYFTRGMIGVLGK
jgi:cytochrome c oxidase subunit 4